MTGATAGSEGSRVVRCRTVAVGRLQQVHHIRGLPTQKSTVDPLALSSADAEPNALELLLSAFGSCLAAGIHANAIFRHIPITSLSLELSGEVDDSVHWGTADRPKPLGFEAIAVSVHIESTSSAKALNALVKHATLWSPVANTLYNPVHLKVSLA